MGRGTVIGRPLCRVFPPRRRRYSLVKVLLVTLAILTPGRAAFLGQLESTGFNVALCIINNSVQGDDFIFIM